MTIQRVFISHFRALWCLYFRGFIDSLKMDNITRLVKSRFYPNGESENKLCPSDCIQYISIILLLHLLLKK